MSYAESSRWSMRRAKWPVCWPIKIGKLQQRIILLLRNSWQGAPATAIKSTITATIWSRKESRCWNSGKCETKRTNRLKCSKIESNYSWDKKQIRKRRLNCSRFKTCRWPRSAKKPNTTRIRMRWEELMMTYSRMSGKDKPHRSEKVELLADITANSSLRKTSSYKDKRWSRKKKIERSRFAWYNQLYTPKTPTSSTDCGWESTGSGIIL